MADKIVALRDPTLTARIVANCPMTYYDGDSQDDDKPPHVRAASGLVAFKEYLAVVQDDANWLALVDDDDTVYGLPLPASPESGARVFSQSRGNRTEKFDLEACIAIPGADGPELIGFGSGSHRGGEWMLRVHESKAMDAVLTERAGHVHLGIDLTAEFLDAERFYDSLRETAEFSGAGLNIEGAVFMDADTVRLFQRGNAPGGGEGAAIDATGDVDWSDLVAHLADPDGTPPPPVSNIRQYDLGELDGVRLTFSDAEYLGNGRVLYSASAEDPNSDRIAGSVLGIIGADGKARWTEVIDEDDTAFEGKIEGLSLDRRHRDTVRFVIDDDDETAPSRIYQARLAASFFLNG